MKYIIKSERVGTVGEVYEPEVWVNLGALLTGGFIEPADKQNTDKPNTDKPKKAKVNKDKE